MRIIDKTAIAEPSRWNVVFSPHASKRWVRMVVIGRFKHVWAFAYASCADCWLIYDVHLEGTAIAVLPNCEKNRDALGRLLRDCEIVSMPKQNRCRWKIGFTCVTAIKHLIGVRCSAWRPDALWRHCLAHGGEPIR